MANTPINAMTATWSSGAQTAIKMNVTDAGPSNALSKLMDLQLGGSTKFQVTKEGYVTATNYTGSVSGSVVVKDSPSLTGPVYPLFVDGVGRRTLRTDSTGFIYDPSTDNLDIGGTFTAAGNVDSTNTTAYLFSSPSSIYLGINNATSIFIGVKSVSSFTRFNTRQVRASSFTGSFTGSISGSRVNTSNITAKKITANTITSSIKGDKANFIKITGSYVFVNDYVIANRFTGSILGTVGDFTKLYADNFEGNITGSISGSKARFISVTGSSGNFSNRVIARSFTGSISGSKAKFNILSGSKASFSKDVTARSFTGSISGSNGYFKILSSSNLRVFDNVVAQDFYGNISGSTGLLCDLSGCNAFFGGRVVATSFTGSFKSTGTISDIISASKATIAINLIAPNINAKDINTVNLDATSITSSIRGTRANFTRLSGSNARIANYVLANSFTGSISGSSGRFIRLSGSNLRSNKIISINITSSISGSNGKFGVISGSNLRIKNNVIATSFTGSISGSFGQFIKVVANQVIANGFTGSISGSSAKFIQLSLTRISASISGSSGYLTNLTSSRALFNTLNVSKITGSISGSVTVGSSNDNNTYRVIFSTKTSGKTTLKTDSGFTYNPFANKVVINGGLQIGKNIDSVASTVSMFSSSTNITIGQQADDLFLAPEALKVIIGADYTQTAFSGSVSGSLSRFTIVSGSTGNFIKLSGSTTNITNLTVNNGKFTYLTSSIISSSKASFTKLTSSNCYVDNDLRVIDKLTVTGSLNFRLPLTGSNPSGRPLFISGAGAIQGYMGIMINGTKYKIPLYAWS